MQLNQVTVGSQNLNQARAFYVSLGLRLIVETDHYLRFECPDGTSTFSVDLDPAVHSDEHVTVYFEVDDLDDRCDDLQRAGVSFDHPPRDQPWLWREARLRDPDGHELCLYHAGPNRRFPPWRLPTDPTQPPPVQPVEIRPIGTVLGGRREATDDHWDSVEATIVLDPATVSPTATAGLSDFSHIEVIYLFHLVDPANVTTGARHPRGRDDWPAVGILAQRAKARPNRLGISTCQLVSVDALAIRIRGLDAIDGTPVLDIKPYVTQFAPREPTRQPTWMTELMTHYWL
jgi:tRNA (Thr-GGU) A37 N-methylase/catechol 2,3-dioxygenase-like lactoylglutathione lyase family enzyme